jgi:spore maturation protein CgeB
LKILLLGSCLNYNLEHYIQMNFQKMGHEVVFYGYREEFGKLGTPIRMAMCRSRSFRQFIQPLALKKINEAIKRIAQELRPDFVLSIKGEAVEPKTIEWIKGELGAKTALWYPDDPRYFKSLVRYNAPSYGYVFTASERAVDMYKEIGIGDVHYLPFACEPTIHKKVKLSNEESKRYCAEVIFVGTYCLRRARFIGALEKAGIKVKVYGPYWSYFKPRGNVYEGIYGPEMVKSFNVARIVLNIHVADDLEYKTNMRTFETAGSGAFLLTDKPYGLEALFAIDEEVVCYNDERELVELCRYYLGNDGERVKIGAKGQNKAHKEHTYQDRVKHILEKMKL